MRSTCIDCLHQQLQYESTLSFTALLCSKWQQKVLAVCLHEAAVPSLVRPGVMTSPRAEWAVRCPVLREVVNRTFMSWRYLLFLLLFHIWSKTQNTYLIYFAVSTFINAVPDSFWHLTRRLRLTTRATPGQALANGRLKSLRFLSWTWCTKYSILVQTLHHLL